jgi:hypothetical protein
MLVEPIINLLVSGRKFAKAQPENALLIEQHHKNFTIVGQRIFFTFVPSANCLNKK